MEKNSRKLLQNFHNHNIISKNINSFCIKPNEGDVVIINDEIAFCFSAEHIKKSFSCRKLFKPKRFSIIEAIGISDNLHIFMNEKLKRINRYYGTEYKLKFIKQTMKEGDNQILICLLAEKSL